MRRMGRQAETINVILYLQRPKNTRDKDQNEMVNACNTKDEGQYLCKKAKRPKLSFQIFLNTPFGWTI